MAAPEYRKCVARLRCCWVGASYAPERLEIAVGKSNYSRLSLDEYDFDKGEHLGLALDTNRSFVANVACTDARFLR